VGHRHGQNPLLFSDPGEDLLYDPPGSPVGDLQLRAAPPRLLELNKEFTVGQKCEQFFETSADYGLADLPSVGEESSPELRVAIRKVQRAHTPYMGISVLSYLTSLLEVSVANGNFVRVYGWNANSTEDNTFSNVWFYARENDVLCEFHWVIDPDDFINPISELAQVVTLRQKAKDI